MPVWSPDQGFIQPVLLTSVFHEGLSFMALGYSFITQQVSVRWPLLLVGHMGCCKPPMWGPGAMPLETLTISMIPVF